MADFRARDADRDRAVELLEAAHVDGQIGDADRELRVGRALAAETLDELTALTRDLRRPRAPDVPPMAPAQGPVRPSARQPSRPSALSGRLLAVVVIAVVALVGLVLASTLLATVSTSDDTSSSRSAPAEPVVSSQGAGFALVPDQVRRFLRLYEDRFGTLDSYSAVFYPQRVIVQVPVRAKTPRYERWTFDGTWRRNAEESAVTGPARIVDLGQVGVARLFANVTTAQQTLRVQGATLTHVVVHRWRDEAPSVNIYVANSANESAYLRTTLPGTRIVRRFPYEP